MAEVTRRLKLKIPSNASGDSRYNLQRIDDWAGALQLSEDGSLTIAVRDSLSLVPNALSAGGSGQGGVLNFGTTENNVQVTFYSSTLTFESPLQLKDQASGGTKSLSLQYKSDADGSGTDTAADRTLSIDTRAGDRSLSLGGNVKTDGDLTVVGGFSVQLNFTAASNITFPVSGLLLTDDSTATLTNKTISGAQNSISNISLTSAVTGILPASNGGTGVSSSATFPSSGMVATVPSSGVVKSTGSSLSSSNVSLTSEVAGILPIANGGTNAATSQGARTNLLPSQTGNSGKVLQTDGTDVSWVNPSAGQVQTFLDTWSSGTSKVVTHGIGTTSVDISVLDENNEVIYVEVTVNSVNQVTLTSSEAPGGVWNILIQGAP